MKDEDRAKIRARAQEPFIAKKVQALIVRLDQQLASFEKDRVGLQAFLQFLRSARDRVPADPIVGLQQALQIVTCSDYDLLSRELDDTPEKIRSMHTDAIRLIYESLWFAASMTTLSEAGYTIEPPKG